MKHHLNCDLGEGEPRQVMVALLRQVTCASIACGSHAGNCESMRSAVTLAIQHGVRIGAHPGLPDREAFGRRALTITPVEFKTLLLQQVSALEKMTRTLGVKLHHIKLHGALYHMVERASSLRRAYLELVREFWPGTVIFALAEGAVIKAATERSVKSWAEGFLDRGYLDKTHLAPRGAPGSLLTRTEFESRIQSLVRFGTITTTSGKSLRIQARTWCIHSDTPEAPYFAKQARANIT